MANRTNRAPREEDKNQDMVEQRKQEIDSGKVPPGIERGSSPRDHEKKS